MDPSTGGPPGPEQDDRFVQSAASNRQEESTSSCCNEDHLHNNHNHTNANNTSNNNSSSSSSRATPPAEGGASPVYSSISSLDVPGLCRTDSTPSFASGRDSLRSHVSIPVVGTFPLGSLRVHKAIDPPRSHPRESTPEDGLRPRTNNNSNMTKYNSNMHLDDPDMPPLEGQDADTDSTVEALPTDRGDVFVILDLPPRSTVGCDSKAIGTGSTSSFQGIRDIPPGAHFIWVAEPNAMSRCGYWFVTASRADSEPETEAEPGSGSGSRQRRNRRRRRVRVKQWDKFNEVLVDPASNFEARDAQENVAALYPQLTPYGFGSLESGGGAQQTMAAIAGRNESSIEKEDESCLWTRLTSSISEQLLARVTGKSRMSEWLVDTADCAAGDSSFPQTKQTQTYHTLAGNGELHFLFAEEDVDVYATTTAADDAARNSNDYPFLYPPRAPPTPGLPDTSDSILRLIDTSGTDIAAADLVGEMQFTFLTGLHLSNLACIEQWWHLVLKIVLRAHTLVLRRPRLALELLATLHAQMVYNERYIASDPEAAFEGELSRREYGGPAVVGNGQGRDVTASASSTSILEIIPGNQRKLRSALTLYKRRMNELLLDLSPLSAAPPQQQQHQGSDDRAAITELGQVFTELEAWFWRFGWDLRSDYVGKRGDPAVGKGKAKGMADLANGDGEDGDGDGDGYGYAYAYGGAGDDDEDEYRPVIVDIDESGREVGLVSFNG